MTDTGDLTIALPDRMHFAAQLVVLTRFVAAVCWFGVLVMLGVMSNGVVLVLLGIPTVVTFTAIWAARGYTRHAFGVPPVFGTEVKVPVFYAAVLTWFGAAFLLFSEVSAIVLIALPLFATFGAYAASKRLKRLVAEAG
ncbi:hypothetical protein [Arthrobacter sp. Br18]|uniref:hypothetical protein n=1 Tax=Arthrobacter sp. Br18 TaxID=1312954 RepID=UPI00047C9E41|nr:hypothetical protein [Arthrobacter sp. Br18]